MTASHRLHTLLLVLILMTGIVIVGLLASRALGGPLDPPGPPGPPGPTMKTLEEVEPRIPISALPFTIDDPGSYYLTGNLQVGPGIDGISVQASDVTIDLNGFALVGGGSQDGIVSTQFPAYANLVVRNGTIAGWRNGIAVEWMQGAMYYDLTLRGNLGSGLRGGSGTLVDHVRAYANGEHGILVNEAATTDQHEGTIIRSSIANGNGLDGIQYNINQNPARLPGAALIEDNVASYNGGAVGAPYGAGIRVNGNRTRVEGNNVTSNDGFGILVTGTNNYVVSNSGSLNLDGTGNSFAYDNFSIYQAGVFNVAPEETSPNVTNILSNVSY